MKSTKLPFLAALVVATALIVGCGPQNDSRLSDADVAYLKQQRLMQMYGLNSNGSTSTSTVVQYVTITNTTTVNH
jgi:hypothetical protein